MAYSTALLRQELTRDLKDGFTRILTANGTTLVATDTTKLPEFEDGRLGGAWYKAITRTANNVGLVRKVDESSQANGQLELVTALPSATAASDGYEVHRRFHPDDKDTAIRRALALIWPDVYVPTEDRSLTTVNGTQVYTLPSTVRRDPASIWLEQDAGQLKPATQLFNWRIRRSGSTIYVEFPYGLPSGKVLRVLHMAELSVATASLTVTGATNATPIVITTSAAHGLTTGDVVTVASVGGNTAANGTWTVTVLTTTTFSLDTSVGNGAYTSGGTVSVERVDLAARELPLVLAQAAVWLYENEWGTSTGQDKTHLDADITRWRAILADRKKELRMRALEPTIHVPTVRR